MPMASGMAMDGDEGSGEVAWSAGGCGECRPKCQAMCSAKTKIPAQDSLPNQSTTVSRASPNLLIKYDEYPFKCFTIIGIG